MISAEFAVIGTKQETRDVKSIKLSFNGNKFDYKPGQYMMMELDVADPKNGSIRSLSIASSPTENFLLFSTKISDTLFKQKFNSLKAGDKVRMKGPMGIFTLKEDAQKVVLLGGGIGITPFRDMIKYVTDKKLPLKITLLYSNRTPADIVYKDEWRVFARENPHLKVVHTITDYQGNDWHGRRGRIDEYLVKEYCSDLQNTPFYICGPPGMVNAMFELLVKIGVPGPNIKIERFVGY